MKLLIITQKVNRNDPVLGFFCRWLEKFSEKVEKLIVVALEVGEETERVLPKNVTVFSLGKDDGESKIKYIYRFFKYIFKFRKDYDAVFVHMNPEYVVLGGWFWQLLRKKVFLWYVHRSAPWQLKVAEKFADKIFTVSKNSCQITSKKIEITGHGIDTDYFEPQILKKFYQNDGKLKVVSIGRISAIKDYKTLIEAAKILLEKKFFDFHINIFGNPIYESDYKYQKEIFDLIKTHDLNDYIAMMGSGNFYAVRIFLGNADILINLCPAGGKDKVVLEAMASGVVPIVANESFRDDFNENADKLIFKHGNPEDLAEKILSLKDKLDNELRLFLRNKVTTKHNLNNLINKIINYYQVSRYA